MLLASVHVTVQSVKGTLLLGSDTHNADTSTATLSENGICAMPTALLYVPSLQHQSSMAPLCQLQQVLFSTVRMDSVLACQCRQV